MPEERLRIPPTEVFAYRIYRLLLKRTNIVSLVQLEYNAFEVATVPVCIYVLRKGCMDYIGRFIQLAQFKGWDNQEPHVRAAIKDFSLDYCFESKQNNYGDIEGTPISYWLSDSVYKNFREAERVTNYGSPKQGLITGDNNVYMRLWYEVDFDKIDFHCTESGCSDKKWFPHSKGGSVRRWYGNNSYIVNWENAGNELKNFKDKKGKLRSRPQNEASYFKTGVTWSDLTISWFSARFVPEGFIFDGCGPTLIPKNNNDLLYLCGYFNSWVFQEFLNITCQGMHYSNGIIAQLPCILDNSFKDEISKLVERNIALSKADWDEHESSWDFKGNVLCGHGFELIEDAVNAYKEQKQCDVTELKNNEATLDDIFASIFGMKDITPSKGICEPTIYVTDDAQLVREYISYAVGCIMGRYSLDKEGIACAGEQFDMSNYISFTPDMDGIIPITDDEYFADDIVSLFINFVKTTFGESRLEDNLTYICKNISSSSNSREGIRNYFLNDFYTDHCNLFAVAGSGKRPIYWMLDSGKKGAFKCLIYMHRYKADTIARVRTDYVHELQSRYRTALEELENRVLSLNGSDKVKANKRLKIITEQSEELHVYEEKIHHLADQMISIDLDDGFKENYSKFSEILAKVK